MYKQKLAAASFVRKSKLIIGLDLVADMCTPSGRRAERDRVESKALSVINATADYAAAYKFNRHLVLPVGLFDGVPKLLDAIHDLGLSAIMDCKINDIGDTNAQIATSYFDAGFDAVIANPFVGWDGGLEPVYSVARKKDAGVITLCYMSHPAANEGYGLYATQDEKGKDTEPMYKIFARRARIWESDGVIVGATYPEIIREVRKILGADIPIISPGVGAQGASAKEAIDAGASYIIAARSIVNADDPSAAARSLVDEMR
ncbi:MAG: orotidine 5'-phosphate decarboxylase [Candidatus Thorarchaeota archaeon]|nr:orotidine 5'-phosphate decarboxylase [Candidatus Thorarchaeota archaeon]